MRVDGQNRDRLINEAASGDTLGEGEKQMITRERENSGGGEALSHMPGSSDRVAG